MFHIDQTGSEEAVPISREATYDRGKMRALATKCRSGLSCLDTGKCENREMCEIEHAVGGNILFIKDDGFTFSCPYKVGFGFSHFCSCPVRSILYKEEKLAACSGTCCSQEVAYSR